MSRLGVVLVAAMVLGTAGCSADSDRVSPPSSALVTETPRLELLVPRAVHHATALADGRVLLTGGCSESGCGGFDAARASELFDPDLAAFVPGPTMTEARASGTATLMPDGRVLLTGGYPGEGMAPTASAEIFDPGSETFVETRPMTSARANHSASLLPDGRVLVSGGQGADGALASTEIFDPRTEAFTAGQPLSAPRAAHAAATVGKHVVLVGGTAEGAALHTTDVFARGGWAAGPALLTPRVKHGAATLPGGRVLVVGGSMTTEGRELLMSTELLELLTGRVTSGPNLSEGEYKLDGAITTLDDGRVVIAGGQQVNVFDPGTGAMTVLRTPVLQRRSFVTATAVGPATVLVAGGYDDAIVPTAEATLVRVPAA
jgi:hypothetical protein